MLKSVSHLTDWMDTHQQMWWVFLRLHQFHFPLGPFFKRPHLPPRNTLITGGKLSAVYFWISWRGEGPLFPAGYCPPFLASQTKPGCDLGTEKKKKKEQKVKLLLFLQESGLAQPQPLGPRPGRSPAGVARPPQGDQAARSFSASWGRLSNVTLLGLPGARFPGWRGPENETRGFRILGRWAGLAWRGGPEAAEPPGAGDHRAGGGHVLRRRAGCAGTAVISGRAAVRSTSSRSTSRAVPGPGSGAKMPALHIEDLPEKEKLKMEVEQLRKEVKLQRQQVIRLSQNISFSEIQQGQLFPVCYSKTNRVWDFCFCSFSWSRALVVPGNCQLL